MLLEPFLMERIDAARDRAQKIYDGVYEDEATLVDVMKWVICQNRNMAFFDPYFDARTLDDLVFETEMIRLYKQDKSTRGSDILKEAPKAESEGLFDDWVEADTAKAEKQFEEDSKAFMQSGDFKE